MVEVRRFGISDVKELRQLLKACWLDTYSGILDDRIITNVIELWQSEENLTRGVQDSDLYYAGYFERGSMLGMVSCGKLDEGTLKIYRLYVLPSSQRKGIGSTLMEDAVRHFSPVKKIVLEVVEGNRKAVAFYRKRGFSFTVETLVKLGKDDIPSLMGELLL
jgi:ribosomal protein S18 acetylase RimI-like enzyme